MLVRPTAQCQQVAVGNGACLRNLTLDICQVLSDSHIVGTHVTHPEFRSVASVEEQVQPVVHGLDQQHLASESLFKDKIGRHRIDLPQGGEKVVIGDKQQFTVNIREETGVAWHNRCNHASTRIAVDHLNTCRHSSPQLILGPLVDDQIQCPEFDRQ